MNWIGIILFGSAFLLSFIVIPFVIFFFLYLLYFIRCKVVVLGPEETIQKNLISTAITNLQEQLGTLITVESLAFLGYLKDFAKSVIKYRQILLIVVLLFSGMLVASEFQEEIFTFTDSFYKNFVSYFLRPIVLAVLNIITFMYGLLSPVVNLTAAILQYPLKALIYIVMYCSRSFVIDLFVSVAKFVIDLIIALEQWVTDGKIFFDALDLKTPMISLLNITQAMSNLNNCTCQASGDLFEITTGSLRQDFIPDFVNNTFNGVFFLARIPVISLVKLQRPYAQPLFVSFIASVNNTGQLVNYIVAETFPNLINTILKKIFNTNVFPPELFERIKKVELPLVPLIPLELGLCLANNSAEIILNIDRFIEGFADSFIKHPKEQQQKNIAYAKSLFDHSALFGLSRQYIDIVANFFDLFFLDTKFEFLKNPPSMLVALVIDHSEYTWILLIDVLFNGIHDPLGNIRENIWYTERTDQLFSAYNATIQAFLFLPSDLINATLIINTNNYNETVINILRDIRAFVFLVSDIVSTALSAVINTIRLYIDFWLNSDHVIHYLFVQYNSNDPIVLDYIVYPNSSFNLLLDAIESDLVVMAIKVGYLTHFTNTKQCKGNFMKECGTFYLEIECYLGDIITNVLELAIYVLRYAITVLKALYSIDLGVLLPEWFAYIRPRVLAIIRDVFAIFNNLITFGMTLKSCPHGCIASILTDLMTNFVKPLFLFIDIFFSLLQDLYLLVKGCGPDDTNCKYSASQFMNATIDDTAQALIDIFKSAGDLVTCFSGDGAAFYEVAHVLQCFVKYFREFGCPIFLDLFKFVVYLLGGNFVSAFEAFARLVVTLFEDILEVLLSIIEFVIEKAFKFIVDAIVQNAFICDICTIFKWIAKIVTWGHAHVHCGNFCHAKACFSDPQNPTAPVCRPSKRTIFTYDTGVGDIDGEDNKLTISEMLSFLSMNRYAKSKTLEINEQHRHIRRKSEEFRSSFKKRSPSLENDMLDGQPKRQSLFDPMESFTNTPPDQNRVSVQHTISDPTILTNMYTMLSYTNVTTKETTITKESCLFAFYAIQNRSVPENYNKMNDDEKAEFKTSNKACTFIEDVFKLTTVASSSESSSSTDPKINEKQKSACDNILELLLEPIESQSEVRLRAILASKCIRERSLVALVNKYILLMGEKYTQYLLDKDFLSDPVIASTNIITIIANTLNDTFINQKSDTDSRFKDFVNLFKTKPFTEGTAGGRKKTRNIDNKTSFNEEDDDEEDDDPKTALSVLGNFHEKRVSLWEESQREFLGQTNKRLLISKELEIIKRNNERRKGRGSNVR